jgi:serine/threonine-protein kinase HipA
LDASSGWPSFLRVDPKGFLREVRTAVKKARALWPQAALELLGEQRADRLLKRMAELLLIKEAVDQPDPESR